MNTNKIVEELLRRTREEVENNKENLIKALNPFASKFEMWGVGFIINDIIAAADVSLEEQGLISEDTDLKELIYSIDENLRDKMFRMLIKPIVEAYRDTDYDVEIDYFFEEIYIINNDYKEDTDYELI